MVSRAGSRFCSLVIIAGFAFFLGFLPTARAATIYVPDDYPTIQMAVDAASPGDTIMVRAGTYVENIEVNKNNLTIKSTDGLSTTIVQAADHDYHVFKITADNVVISRFTVEGATTSAAGVYLSSIQHCRIFSMKVRGNYYGIYLGSASYNELHHLTLENNTVGIYLNSSTHNSLHDNLVSANDYGIHLSYESNDNTLSDTTVVDNLAGIYLYSSSCNNTLTNNKLDRNHTAILCISSSTSNVIYLNDFTANNSNVSVDDSSTNIWSSPQTLTYTYHGTIYTSRLGNYWSTYTDSDTDGDGIGDTPYEINAVNADEYPLVEPSDNYTITENENPVADFVYTPSSPLAGEEVSFDASSSHDPDGQIVSYEWDFGDGSTGQGQLITHPYSQAGTYAVKLTVTDDLGAQGFTSKDIVIQEATPPALVQDFQASDGEDGQSTLTWTNPPDADLAEVIVLRKTGGYPSNHEDGVAVYRAPSDTNPRPVSGAKEQHVDTGLINGTTYYYAVFSRDTAGKWNDTVEQGKNADTAIPGVNRFIRIISPNGGEEWPVGSTQKIRWESQNAGAYVKIEYSTDGGTTWKTIVETTENDGPYTWTIPDTRSTHCRVRITSKNFPSVQDISDSDFVILYERLWQELNGALTQVGNTEYSLVNTEIDSLGSIFYFLKDAESFEKNIGLATFLLKAGFTALDALSAIASGIEAVKTIPKAATAVNNDVKSAVAAVKITKAVGSIRSLASTMRDEGLGDATDLLSPWLAKACDGQREVFGNAKTLMDGVIERWDEWNGLSRQQIQKAVGELLDEVTAESKELSSDLQQLASRIFPEKHIPQHLTEVVSHLIRQLQSLSLVLKQATEHKRQLTTWASFMLPKIPIIEMGAVFNFEATMYELALELKRIQQERLGVAVTSVGLGASVTAGAAALKLAAGISTSGGSTLLEAVAVLGGIGVAAVSDYVGQGKLDELKANTLQIVSATIAEAVLAFYEEVAVFTSLPKQIGGWLETVGDLPNVHLLEDTVDVQIVPQTWPPWLTGSVSVQNNDPLSVDASVVCCVYTVTKLDDASQASCQLVSMITSDFLPISGGSRGTLRFSGVIFPAWLGGYESTYLIDISIQLVYKTIGPGFLVDNYAVLSELPVKRLVYVPPPSKRQFIRDSELAENTVSTGQKREYPLSIKDTTKEALIVLDWEGSDLDLHLYDPDGLHVGVDYGTGMLQYQIPNVTYTGNGTKPEIIRIFDPRPGNYKISVVGVDAHNTKFTIRVIELPFLGGSLVSIPSKVSARLPRGVRWQQELLLVEPTGHSGVKNIEISTTGLRLERTGALLPVTATCSSNYTEPGGILVVNLSGVVPPDAEVGKYSGEVLVKGYAMRSSTGRPVELHIPLEINVEEEHGELTVINGPNPVPPEGCIFWLNLPDDAVEATLKIFDIDGALLVSIPLDPAADRYPETGRWIPEDAQGRLLGTGLYLYCVEIKHADGTVTYSPVQKMVIKR